MVIKLHPIVEGFLKAKEPLGVIIERYCDRDNLLEAAFLVLSKEFGKIELNHEFLFELDRAIIAGHQDSNLFLFFICQVVSYFQKHNQFEKAKSALFIGTSISSKNINLFIKAILISQFAMHKRWDGKIEECNQLMKESISLIDKNEPRANVLLQNYYTNIAFCGQLKENNVYQLDELEGLLPQHYLMVSSQIKIISCIVTGNYEEGFRVMEACKNHELYNKDNNFNSLFDLLKISSSDFNSMNYELLEGQIIVSAFKCFSIGKFDEAMRHYYQINENFKLSHMNLTFNYLPLHYELCTGNSGKARLLLQEKINKNDVFYMDDLFLGRLQLLENDDFGADESFRRLIENINRYGAMPRLEFELQFAKELNLSIILKLINGWKQEGKTSPSKIKSVKKILPKEIKKGINLIIGNSDGISNIKELVKKYSDVHAPILITGETGTGKELVSRAIHEEGLFPKEPFLAINCGALTETLLQSELFGYVAGAFTGAQKQRKGIFESAGKGTVFLDEFGDISPKLQVSLLRVLEANEIRMIGSTKTQKIECKIIIATNVDLQKAVIDKRFREDLFFRLARFEIKLPALRDRKEDIPLLIGNFLTMDANDLLSNKILAPELLKMLTNYSWPGNIRELKNEIERLLILNPGVKVLKPEHFDFSHLQINPNEIVNIEQVKSNIEPNVLDQLSNDESYSKIIQSGFRTERRQILIKELFKKHQKLTRNQIMRITNIGPTTATKDLQNLIDSGFIVRRTPTKSKSTDYFELSK